MVFETRKLLQEWGARCPVARDSGNAGLVRVVGTLRECWTIDGGVPMPYPAPTIPARPLRGGGRAGVGFPFATLIDAGWASS